MTSAAAPLLAVDRAHLRGRLAPLRAALAGARLFVTGGTGTYGRWVLEALGVLTADLQCDVTATVLTRTPDRFLRAVPHLATHHAIRLATGDVTSFAPPDGAFSHVMHMAGEPDGPRYQTAGSRIVTDYLAGTQRVLEFARERGTHRLLLTSSGAVYGSLRAGMRQVSESFVGDECSLYGHGKRQAEAVCFASGVPVIVARGFAVVGLHVPLDGVFAAGNFVRDALAGGPIRVLGDGTPLRSYLYAADLAVWLLTLLVRGDPGQAYNVGSDQAVSIRHLADAVARRFDPPPAVTVAKTPDPTQPPTCYVPCAAKARALGLDAWVGLDDALARTARYYQGGR